jgi:hypothetical protein
MHFIWGDMAVITGCVDWWSGTELFSSHRFSQILTDSHRFQHHRAIRLFGTARCQICAGKSINIFITINYNYVSAHVGHVYLRKSLYRVHYPAFCRIFVSLTGIIYMAFSAAEIPSVTVWP